MTHTLCWDCANATKEGICEWADGLKPVKGWTAEETVRKEGTEDEMRSFLVISCPKFKRDAYFGGLKRTLELTPAEAARILQEDAMDGHST